MRRGRKRLTERILPYMSSPVAVAEGLWCALSTPVWLDGTRLRRLLAGNADDPAMPSCRVPESEARLAAAIAAASTSLRVLARLPRSPWRDTCLYRSVATCLLCWRYGLPARLVLGVRRGGGDDPVEAHAWVAGRGRYSDAIPLQPLRASRESASPAGTWKSWNLLRDGALVLTAEQETLPPVKVWLPRARKSEVSEPGSINSAEILVRAGAPLALRRRSPQTQRGEPDLRLGSTAAWFGDGGDAVQIRGSAGYVLAHVDLGRRRSEVGVSPDSIFRNQWTIRDRSTRDDQDEDPVAAPYSSVELARETTHSGVTWELYSTLTLASALLLGRTRRTLMHSGAVVDPHGEVWLIAGDARSGKSSVCAGLIGAGWNYLADDQTILRAAGNTVTAEGWPRAFHLDEGWWEGEPAGLRMEVEPRHLGPGEWQPTGPVAGVLIPEVCPGEETRVREATASDTLTLLIRQSPWLLSDKRIAKEILDLLVRVAHVPAFHLILGREAFGNSDPLLRALGKSGIGK